MATNNSINTPLLNPVTRGGTGLAAVTQFAGVAGNGTSALTVLGLLDDGEFYIGATGAAMAPGTITAGTNITVTPSANGVTIDATGSGALAYTEVTGTSATMAANNAYGANNAGLVTLTLPATAAVGEVVSADLIGAGGFLIAQNSGQNCRVGSSTTTTGVGGSIASSASGDSITLRCIVADTTFVAVGGWGNLTIV